MVNNISNLAFQSADNLWHSYEKGLVGIINYTGGAATINPDQISPPEWNSVKMYINGQMSLSTLHAMGGCDGA